MSIMKCMLTHSRPAILAGSCSLSPRMYRDVSAFWRETAFSSFLKWQSFKVILLWLPNSESPQIFCNESVFANTLCTGFVGFIPMPMPCHANAILVDTSQIRPWAQGVDTSLDTSWAQRAVVPWTYIYVLGCEWVKNDIFGLYWCYSCCCWWKTCFFRNKSGITQQPDLRFSFRFFLMVRLC